MSGDIDFSLYSASEILGMEFYKTYHIRSRLKTERPAHEIVWRVKYMTTMGTLPEAHRFSGTIREMARQYDGLIVERMDNNSKAQPAGTLKWHRRAWLDPNHRGYGDFKRQGFKVRRQHG